MKLLELIKIDNRFEKSVNLTLDLYVQDMCLVCQRPCPFRLRMNLPALNPGHSADNDPVDSGKVNCAGIVE